MTWSRALPPCAPPISTVLPNERRVPVRCRDGRHRSMELGGKEALSHCAPLPLAANSLSQLHLLELERCIMMVAQGSECDSDLQTASQRQRRDGHVSSVA